MLGLIEKKISIRVFGIAKVCDGAHRRPSVNTIFFSLNRWKIYSVSIFHRVRRIFYIYMFL